MAELLPNYAYQLDDYDLQNPVPEDLYRPFGSFLEDYNITAAFQTVCHISYGVGDLLETSTIYAIKYFSPGDCQALVQRYLTHARGNNLELYAKVGDYIGESNILLKSNVVVAVNRQRTATWRSEILISTRGEGLKLLSCGEVLLTIPPMLENLREWDLNPEEDAVFPQYSTANGYYTGPVQDVGLNQTLSYYSSAASTPFNIPVLLALYALAPVGRHRRRRVVRQFRRW